MRGYVRFWPGNEVRGCCAVRGPATLWPFLNNSSINQLNGIVMAYQYGSANQYVALNISALIGTLYVNEIKLYIGK